MVFLLHNINCDRFVNEFSDEHSVAHTRCMYIMWSILTFIQTPNVYFTLQMPFDQDAFGIVVHLTEATRLRLRSTAEAWSNKVYNCKKKRTRKKTKWRIETNETNPSNVYTQLEWISNTVVEVSLSKANGKNNNNLQWWRRVRKSFANL